MKISIMIKLAIGFLALGLGAVGLLLPVWPTTPFVLVAVGCFSSTPKIQSKILKIHIFREYYEGYTQGKGLCSQTVAKSLCFLWGMLLLSAVIVRKPMVILILAIVGIVVTIHILCIAKSKNKAEQSNQNKIE